MKLRLIIYIVSLLIICVLISVLVCYFVFLKDPKISMFSMDETTDYVGLFVSCISIVITAFLVLLAIEGYGKIEKIKKVAKVSEDAHSDLISHLRGIGDVTKIIYDVAIEMTNTLGRSINRERDEKSFNIYMNRLASFQRGYYRLGLKPFLLSDEERVSLINNLAIDKDEEEIENNKKELKKLFNSTDESPQVKEAARRVLCIIDNAHTSSLPSDITNSSWSDRIKSFFKGQRRLFKELFGRQCSGTV